MNGVLIDLTRQNRGKFVGKPFQPRLFLGNIALELVIGDKSRNCRKQPYRGREKRLRYARRDDR